MGDGWSKHVSGFLHRNHRRVLLVGLDNSGKTSLLNILDQHPDPSNTIPTTDYNFVDLKYKKFRLALWDVGGQDKLRPFWRHHYTGTQGVVYIVDSSDVDRIELSRAELNLLLQDSQLQDVPVLIFANKQDLPNSLGKEELATMLGVPVGKIAEGGGHDVYYQEAVVKKGTGVYEGIEWLCKHMKKI